MFSRIQGGKKKLVCFEISIKSQRNVIRFNSRLEIGYFYFSNHTEYESDISKNTKITARHISGLTMLRDYTIVCF